MKGQYLAVESVLTFGMGLIVALGTVTAFSNYTGSMMDTAGERQVAMVESELASAVYSLETVDYGEKDVELPDDIGGSTYTIVFDDGIKILVDNREHFTRLDHFRDHQFRGSTDGGPVKVFKSGEQFTIEAN